MMDGIENGEKQFMRPAKNILFIFLIFMVVISGGCGIKQGENNVEQFEVLMQLSKNVTLKENICYQETESNQCYMDVAYIEDGKEKPLIVCIHGGAWSYGTRKEMESLLYSFSNIGYVVASIDYDTLPDASIVEQGLCVEKALNYIIAMADTYEIDSNRVILVGSSSGAQLALRFGEEVVKNSEKYAFHLEAMVDLFGPTDLSYVLLESDNADTNTMISHSEWIDGQQNSDFQMELKKIDVIQNITSNLPPILIIHGTEDQRVPISVSESFYNELQKEGITSKFVEIYGMGHELNAEKILPEIQTFFESYIK